MHVYARLCTAAQSSPRYYVVDLPAALWRVLRSYMITVLDVLLGCSVGCTVGMQCGMYCWDVVWDVLLGYSVGCTVGM